VLHVSRSAQPLLTYLHLALSLSLPPYVSRFTMKTPNSAATDRGCQPLNSTLTHYSQATSWFCSPFARFVTREISIRLIMSLIHRGQVLQVGKYSLLAPDATANMNYTLECVELDTWVLDSFPCSNVHRSAFLLLSAYQGSDCEHLECPIQMHCRFGGIYCLCLHGGSSQHTSIKHRQRSFFFEFANVI
jgi:hypothetical protein